MTQYTHQPLCSRCGVPCENPPVRVGAAHVAGQDLDNVVLCEDCNALSCGTAEDRRAFWDGWEERLRREGMA